MTESMSFICSLMLACKAADDSWALLGGICWGDASFYCKISDESSEPGLGAGRYWISPMSILCDLIDSSMSEILCAIYSISCIVWATYWSLLVLLPTPCNTGYVKECIDCSASFLKCIECKVWLFWFNWVTVYAPVWTSLLSFSMKELTSLNAADTVF